MTSQVSPTQNPAASSYSTPVKHHSSSSAGAGGDLVSRCSPATPAQTLSGGGGVDLLATPTGSSASAGAGPPSSAHKSRQTPLSERQQMAILMQMQSGRGM